jgi:hypothetical protein
VQPSGAKSFSADRSRLLRVRVSSNAPADFTGNKVPNNILCERYLSLLHSPEESIP